MNDLKCVFRNFSLSIPTFDHLKHFQREYERQHNVKLSNSQVLAIMLRQHQELIAGSKCDD
ncbi:hypothetical protein [Propionivibrio dicarboxylicus]|uniref:Uncharacterized protein n=1 Tax=Propionivibrio dicarboxylicus TaxID=83767 RepID=A0A1G8JKV0_9RHOO|nr:hypothetical protein [Propionivibrio dicarboxylicus]SDI31647.1 hypothetical protein SAMN05660652_03234 [Propionivibrio dicarboxylicus]